MEKVTSADGTTIAFERSGTGPALILIGGAFNDRSTTAGVRAGLADVATGYSYDRRGRGDSDDRSEPGTFPLEREIDDLAALIAHAGGEAALFGHSSGATLALNAVAHGLPVTRVAVYEPPYVAAGVFDPSPAERAKRMRELVAEDRRDDAVTLFMTGAGMPAEAVADLRKSPAWPGLAALAHSLPYDVGMFEADATFPAATAAAIGVPTLVLNGTASGPFLIGGARSVAAAVEGAEHVEIEGEDHAILRRPEILVPILARFLTKG
ncbi:MAG TPA: alpha/beta hydrolase [Pseudonocardiaceae bacterium]